MSKYDHDDLGAAKGIVVGVILSLFLVAVFLLCLATAEKVANSLPHDPVFVKDLR